MKRLSIFFILFLFIAFLPVNSRTADENQRLPFTSIQQAIRIAENYARQRELDLQGKYIGRAEYHWRKSENPYWSIIWINEYITKGGVVEIKAFADGRMEDAYHK